ncbi:WhiB family transcriptional regulator [Amycolatopsis sp. CA-230715]|uniref:WhiB family transcriptional regulator n=1 Tax=Amycolatopsis sp. CA-230715 TaxID=2745196 RepID=UPI001C33687B|nr:WhiB family transcriptional regulator [Amycolatopsis sp. CA-230715]QWF85710.1 Transcriptional regulator WhiB [Amycolatopsis sp. CA-230715]
MSKMDGELDVTVDDDETWREDALCREADPDAFFPDRGGRVVEAKRICARCDVQAQCLLDALRNDERFGVWGGLSPRERRRIRRDVAAPPLTHVQLRRRDRDDTIVALAKQHFTAPAIAAKIGVSDQTVYRVLGRQRQRDEHPRRMA